MASNSSKEGTIDGTFKVPDSCSLQLLDQNFHEDNQHYSLDVFPILFEEASFPVKGNCAFHSSHGQDVYSISVLPEGSHTSQQCTSDLTFLSFLEVPSPHANQMCLNSSFGYQNCINLKMDAADDYSPCIVDIDIEKENLETPEVIDQTVGSEGVLPRGFWQQESLKLGGKFMQLLMNSSSMLLNFNSKADKSVGERLHDAPSNRWRRYKRAASFDSRKVVLLFSILSSLGTLVLIYLTLSVRQIND